MSRLMRLLALIGAACFPAIAFAQTATQPKYFKFEPDPTMTTLGIIYTVAMVFTFLYVGWYFRRKSSASSDGYFAAGRQFGGINNGLAMTSNYLSLATFLGFTALAWGLQWFLIAIVCSFLGGFVMISIALAPSLRRWGKFTSMQFIGERFGTTAKIIAVLCMILLAALYLIGQMKGNANMFQVMFGWDYTLALIVGGLIVTIYVTVGGMYGLSYNQTLQAVIMLFAMVIPTVIILQNLGAGPEALFPPFGYAALVPGMEKAMPTYFDPFVAAGGKAPLSFKFYVGVILSIAFGTMGLPHIAMRYFTAPSVRDGKMSTWWGILFVGIVFFTTFGLGVAAKLFTITELMAKQGLEVQPKEADILVVVMAQQFTPSWIAAMPIAGALAAGLSTIGGLLGVIGAGIGHDIYSTLKPKATDHSKVRMGILFTFLGGVVAILLTLDPPPFLLTSVIWAFVVAASTFTPILVMGIWWKGVNTAGAIAGMVVGAVLSVALWWTKGTLFGVTLVNLGPLGYLVTGIFSVSAAWLTLVVVSLLTGGEKNEERLRQIDRIHGWNDYDSRRYNGKLFPLATAAIALLIMIWSAMPDQPINFKRTIAEAPTPTAVASVQR